MNQRKLYVALGLALVATWLLLAMPSRAQVTGSMEGELRGPDGQPLADVTVVIERQDIKQHFETKTDKRGHWFHTGLPLSQNYNVIFKRGDQLLYTWSRVPVRPAETTTLNLNLKDEAEKARRNPPQETEEQRKRREVAEKQRQSFTDLKKHFDQGVVYLNNKQYDLAVPEFEACSRIDATQHVVFANLADAYAGLKRNDEAVAAYEKALELKPEEAAYHNNLGSHLGRMGKVPEAQAHFTKAAELDPPGAGRYYFNLGAVMVNTGKTDEAVEAFRKSIAADPNYADAYYQLGVSLTAKATVDPAGKVIPAPGTVEALQKYLELQPEGRYAQSTKDLLATLGSEIQTQVSTKKPKKK